MFGGIKLAMETNAWLRSMDQEKKPMTNADRIRAMSDDELARFIIFVERQDWLQENELLLWLQQPAEVE